MPWLYWADAVGLTIIAALALDWLRERRALRAYVDSLGLSPGGTRESALSLAVRLAEMPRTGDDPPYLHPLLSPLGPTVSGVLRKGACCSGYSRLAILACELLELPAYQITVYHRCQLARHCLIEVETRDGPMIVDPIFALVYVGPDGRFLGIRDLQAGVPVLFHPLRPAGRPGYPPKDYFGFDFLLTRTANWTKSWPRRAAYPILRGLSAGRVDRWRLPPALEWPQVLLILATLLLGALGHLSAALL